MLAKIHSAGLLGIEAYLVEIEVDVSSGLPTEVVVGLPDAAVKESKERVRTALQNSGFSYSEDRITINLAPADVKKEGPSFDLPIALGVLAADGKIARRDFSPYLIVGELALDGSIRPVRGVLSIALLARKLKNRPLLVPAANAPEAAMVKGVEVRAVSTLAETVRFLEGETDLPVVEVNPEAILDQSRSSEFDFADVRGQELVKRAIEVGVAGGHNILMIGPPGAGKSMLARRIPTILPPLSLGEALESTRIYSSMGLLPGDRPLLAVPPFHSPHHTISDIALVGGGARIRPGEVSLSHNGVLFLDELPEFSRNALEVLRQPLENGEVTISRATGSITFPSRFMLVAAMNPCPCGYFTDPRRECRCNPGQIRKYISKVSGPLLDRIDIHVEVSAVKFEDLAEKRPGESSEAIRLRVEKARGVQKERFAHSRARRNAEMGSSHLRRFAVPDQEGRELLKMAMSELGLSARAYDRILKVARTIADLEGEAEIRPYHLSEAIQYRALDRRFWI